MFRDTSEELERLQAELLAEEEPEETNAQEPPEDDYDDYEEEYEEAYEEDEEPEVYRNYASGYRAYNSDTSDEDLEEYSEEVHAGGKTRGGYCLALIACFLALILAGMVFWIIYTMGYLG